MAKSQDGKRSERLAVGARTLANCSVWLLCAPFTIGLGYLPNIIWHRNGVINLESGEFLQTGLVRWSSLWQPARLPAGRAASLRESIIRRIKIDQ